MPETVTLEQDTAELPAETPGEPVPQDIAETEEQETTETEETQEPPSSPFAGKDFDEIAKDPDVEKVIKDRLAKHEESLRQRAEAERARALQEQQAQFYIQQRQQAAAASTDWAANYLRAAAKQAEEQGKDLDPGHIVTVARSLSQAALITANEGVRAVAEDYLTRFYPDFRIPQPLNQAFAAAQASQDVPAQMQVLFAIVDSANRERIAAEVRAQMSREQQDEASKASQVEAERKAAQQARSGPKPAGGAAVPARPRPLTELLGDPTVSSKDKDKAFMAKYGFAPPR